MCPTHAILRLMRFEFPIRAPFAILHLLREESVERAVEAFPDAEAIFEQNIQTLEKLGHAGWKALGL